MLAYVGHLTSHFWLTVFVQAIIFIYLSYILTRVCLKLPFHTFVWITAATLILSPVSFYIGLLLPDIFASYLIIGTTILAIFWDSLERSQRVLVGAIVAFAALSHSTHILILIALICVFLGLWAFSRGSKPPFTAIRVRLFLLVALALGGILGEIISYEGIRLTTGTSPLRPPVLMGRLIADGPGYRYLLNNCTTKHYIACDYLDRMPATQDEFCWSSDPKKGVFSAVDDLGVKQKLSEEQFRFAFDVLRWDPIGQLTISARNAVQQFVMIGLDEFYLSRVDLLDYQKNLPPEYFDKFKTGRITSSDATLKAAELWFFGFYAVSFCGLLLILLTPFRSLAGLDLRGVRSAPYRNLFTLGMAGAVINACICGVLSGDYDRYQTRLSWILVFMMLLALDHLFSHRHSPPV
jgi:hypothetical protein